MDVSTVFKAEEEIFAYFTWVLIRLDLPALWFLPQILEIKARYLIIEVSVASVATADVALMIYSCCCCILCAHRWISNIKCIFHVISLCDLSLLCPML